MQQRKNKRRICNKKERDKGYAELSETVRNPDSIKISQF
jgi:hypothetical protein